MIDSWIQQLSDVFPGERSFAMIVAYAGSHNSVIAGYWGSKNQWRRFERKWGKVLYKYKIEEFHAREFWKRNPKGEGVGDYRGWSREKLSDFIESLLKVLREVEVFPFASGVLSEEWVKRNHIDRRVFSGGHGKHMSGCPSRSQFLGFQISVFRVAQYCKPGVVAHFVMDKDPSTVGWTGLCYANLRHIAEQDNDPIANALGPITFDDSKKCLPLQAADLLGYEAHQWAKAAYQSNDMHHKMRRTYVLALARFIDKHDFILFDAPRFANLTRAIKERADAQKQGI
jgi:hypothetical protein